jgi:hypothetical protein
MFEGIKLHMLVLFSVVLKLCRVRSTGGVVMREKPVPVPLYPPHVSHGLTHDQTWASMMRGHN